MQSCVGQWLPSGIIPSAPPYIPINRAEIYCDRGGPLRRQRFFLFHQQSLSSRLDPHQSLLVYRNKNGYHYDSRKARA